MTNHLARLPISVPLLFLMLSLTVSAAAQSTALSGRVIDATGAVVPGVTVTATPTTSGDRRTVVTDRDGLFRFDRLPAGTYDVEAEILGFRPVVVRGVNAAESRSIDLRLDAAGISESVTVTAARVATPVAALPTSVTVLGRESLDEQTALSRNLHTILGKTLPGFGLSRESESSFGQNLRGRGMLVLLDGVPQNFELRQGALDELSRIDPSRIERIEVVRGASAVYGSEAAGGIINIITKSGAGDAVSLNTELGTTFSATHPGDSGAGRVFPAARRSAREPSRTSPL